MDGICGWSRAPAAHASEALVARMCQPMAAAPDAALTLNGATCFAAGAIGHVARNDRMLACICGQPRFSTAGNDADPAQWVLSVYSRLGGAIVEHIHGPFALAIIDTREDTAFIAVDRLGVQPLYYVSDGSGFAFASRADSLANHPTSTREIDPQALFDYLYFHCVPAPRAIYLNQKKLLPGQCLTFRNGHVQTRFYWSVHYAPSPAPYLELRHRFLTVLRESVQRASDGHTPGAFLSGGTDSSTVSGLLAATLEAPPKTYSIGFDASGYDEINYARIASRHFKTQSHEYYVTPKDVLDAIPLIAAAYDEPFGNASAVPTYYCARNAHSDGIALVLAGDGGDELFAGNARYARQLLFEQYRRLPRPLRKGLLEPLALQMPGMGWLPPVRKLRSYIEQALVPLPDRLETYNFFHRTLPEEILSADFLASVDTSLPLVGLRDVYERTSNPHPLYSMLHLDLKLTLADNDLRKVTRMCNLAGIDVRYPLLDEAVVEFSAQLPTQLLLRRFKLRYFFKKALSDFLPQEILAKSKHGFGLPFGLWLLDYAPLRELAYDSLESLKKRGYLRPQYIDALRTSHRNDDPAFYGVMIWVLMILEHWFQAHGH